MRGRKKSSRREKLLKEPQAEVEGGPPTRYHSGKPWSLVVREVCRPMIKIEKLCVTAGSFQLKRMSLELATGEYGVLMGKTGCGKTTLAECLCGLRPIDSGKIWLAGVDVTHSRPAERNIGYVPQEGALFPRMTVRQNIAFPLIIRKWSTSAIEKRTAEVAAELGLTMLLERHPARLSGGEIQRVALARAIVFRPPLLVLDEPLAALDDETRLELYEVLKAVQANTGVTTLQITHHQDDAEQLGNQVFHLAEGLLTAKSKTNPTSQEFHRKKITSS